MNIHKALMTVLNRRQYWQQVTSALGPSNILGYFPTWDASGAVADEIVNNRDGAYLATTVLGAVGIGDGRTSANVNASGGLDMYTAALAAVFSGDLGFKSFWIAPALAGYWTDNTQHHIAISAVSATMYYFLRKNVDNTVNFYSRRGGTIKLVSVDSPTTARWVHYLITWDTTNDRITLYINGSRQPRTSTLGTWTGALGATYCRVGNTSPAFGLDPFPGRVAHCIEGGIALPTDSAVRRVANNAQGQVVFVGDSRSTVSKQWASAAVEAAFPAGLRAYGGHGYANWAVTGYATQNLIDEAAAGVDTLIGTGKNTLVVWIGVNDNGTLTAQQIYDNIETYCIARRAAGWNKIIVCTEIDSTAAGWTAKYEALNVLLAADYAFADALADLGAETELQDATNATYFTDGTHLTAAGYAVVRDVVAPVIAAV